MHVDCNRFCHRLILSLWSELLMTYCCVLGGFSSSSSSSSLVSARKREWYVGIYLNLFLTHNGWRKKKNLGGGISRFSSCCCCFVYFCSCFLMQHHDLNSKSSYQNNCFLAKPVKASSFKILLLTNSRCPWAWLQYFIENGKGTISDCS